MGINISIFNRRSGNSLVYPCAIERIDKGNGGLILEINKPERPANIQDNELVNACAHLKPLLSSN